MSYQERLYTKAVLRLEDNAIIDPENKKEWKEYKKWLSAGNKPLPPEEPVVNIIQPTVEEKLASVGITKEELKKLLEL